MFHNKGVLMMVKWDHSALDGYKVHIYNKMHVHIWQCNEGENLVLWDIFVVKVHIWQDQQWDMVHS